ncbi:MAG: hypothetical protein R2851_03030 [Caldilineaceae bacterium]
MVASNMSLYGEGAYRDCDDKIVAGRSRGLDQLRQGGWGLMDSGRAAAACPRRKAPCRT